MAANDSIKPEILDQSILFAHFASAAYLNRTIATVRDLKLVTHEERYNYDNTFNKTDTQATFSVLGDNIVIAFRGTEGKVRDWWTDLNGGLVPNSEGQGKVHRGFNKALDSIYNQMVRYIKNHREVAARPRLVLCGHSLGGALALTAAVRLLADTTRNPDKKIPEILGVFTYGAPRVGDEAYANAYKQSGLGRKTHMFVAKKDPVARIAPYSASYRHAVDRQYILEQGSIGITSLDSKREFEVAERRGGFIQGAIGLFSHLVNAVTDFDAAEHRMNESYLLQLQQARLLQQKS